MFNNQCYGLWVVSPIKFRSCINWFLITVAFIIHINLNTGFCLKINNCSKFTTSYKFLVKYSYAIHWISIHLFAFMNIPIYDMQVCTICSQVFAGGKIYSGFDRYCWFFVSQRSHHEGRKFKNSIKLKKNIPFHQ